MRRRKLMSLLLACVVLTSGPAADATMMLRSFSPKQMYDLAGYVFAGTVTSVQGKRTGGTILSKVSFKDVHLAKGSISTKGLLLTLDGGTDGNEVIMVDGQPQFSVGRRYIVFVTKDLGSTKPHMPVIGLGQGCYFVRDDSTVCMGRWPVLGLTPETLTIAVPDSLGWPESSQSRSAFRYVPASKTAGRRWIKEAEFLAIVRKFSESSEEPR